MKPYILCILLGMNPSHIASISHVYESEVVEFTRGRVFACVRGKEEKIGVLIERGLDVEKKDKGGLSEF